MSLCVYLCIYSDTYTILIFKNWSVSLIIVCHKRNKNQLFFYYPKLTLKVEKMMQPVSKKVSFEVSSIILLTLVRKFQTPISVSDNFCIVLCLFVFFFAAISKIFFFSHPHQNHHPTSEKVKKICNFFFLPLFLNLFFFFFSVFFFFFFLFTRINILDCIKTLTN